MKIKSINLETVCGVSSRLPNNVLPEFAFAGKSNVGKSSLINAFMMRKSYARVSSQPGKTQTINYYNINSEFYLVDAELDEGNSLALICYCRGNNGGCGTTAGNCGGCR